MIPIGLIGNLKTASSPMYSLYLTMKERSPDQFTKEEILVASGQKVIDPGAILELISRVGSANEDIRRAFEKQARGTVVRGHLFSSLQYLSGALTFLRAHGINRSLTICWQNGLWPLINLSLLLMSPNSVHCWHTHTTSHQDSRSLIAMLLEGGL